jgi:hypothetical protein
LFLFVFVYDLEFCVHGLLPRIVSGGRRLLGRFGLSLLLGLLLRRLLID